MIALYGVDARFTFLQVVQSKFEKPLPLLDLMPRLGHELVSLGNP